MTIAPEGRRLMRVEARNTQTPIERKPAWIRTTAKMGPQFTAINAMVSSAGLHTVCQEAGCPNIFECWEDKEATFLIGGDTCTRRCDFCDIATGRPAPLDEDEPRRVADSVAQMGLRYATVTGVAGTTSRRCGGLYAETIRAIHARNPPPASKSCPRFRGPSELVGLLYARPEVSPTTSRRSPGFAIRPAFTYDKSSVLTMARRRAHEVEPHPRNG